MFLFKSLLLLYFYTMMVIMKLNLHVDWDQCEICIRQKRIFLWWIHILCMSRGFASPGRLWSSWLYPRLHSFWHSYLPSWYMAWPGPPWVFPVHILTSSQPQASISNRQWTIRLDVLQEVGIIYAAFIFPVTALGMTLGDWGWRRLWGSWLLSCCWRQEAMRFLFVTNLMSILF